MRPETLIQPPRKEQSNKVEVNSLSEEDTALLEGTNSLFESLSNYSRPDDIDFDAPPDFIVKNDGLGINVSIGHQDEPAIRFNTFRAGVLPVSDPRSGSRLRRFPYSSIEVNLGGHAVSISLDEEGLKAYDPKGNHVDNKAALELLQLASLPFYESDLLTLSAKYENSILVEDNVSFSKISRWCKRQNSQEITVDKYMASLDPRNISRRKILQLGSAAVAGFGAGLFTGVEAVPPEVVEVTSPGPPEIIVVESPPHEITTVVTEVIIQKTKDEVREKFERLGVADFTMAFDTMMDISDLLAAQSPIWTRNGLLNDLVYVADGEGEWHDELLLQYTDNWKESEEIHLTSEELDQLIDNLQIENNGDDTTLKDEEFRGLLRRVGRYFPYVVEAMKGSVELITSQEVSRRGHVGSYDRIEGVIDLYCPAENINPALDVIIHEADHGLDLDKEMFTRNCTRRNGVDFLENRSLTALRVLKDWVSLTEEEMIADPGDRGNFPTIYSNESLLQTKDDLEIIREEIELLGDRLGLSVEKIDRKVEKALGDTHNGLVYSILLHRAVHKARGITSKDAASITQEDRQYLAAYNDVNVANAITQEAMHRMVGTEFTRNESFMDSDLFYNYRRLIEVKTVHTLGCGMPSSWNLETIKYDILGYERPVGEPEVVNLVESDFYTADQLDYFGKEPLLVEGKTKMQERFQFILSDSTIKGEGTTPLLFNSKEGSFIAFIPIDKGESVQPFGEYSDIQMPDLAEYETEMVQDQMAVHAGGYQIILTLVEDNETPWGIPILQLNGNEIPVGQFHHGTERWDSTNRVKSALVTPGATASDAYLVFPRAHDEVAIIPEVDFPVDELALMASMKTWIEARYKDKAGNFISTENIVLARAYHSDTLYKGSDVGIPMHKRRYLSIEQEAGANGTETFFTSERGLRYKVNLSQRAQEALSGLDLSSHRVSLEYDLIVNPSSPHRDDALYLSCIIMDEEYELVEVLHLKSEDVEVVEV